MAMVLLGGTERALARLMKVMALTTRLRSEAVALVDSARESSLLRHDPVVTALRIQPPLSTMTARTKTSTTASVQGSREPHRALRSECLSSDSEKTVAIHADCSFPADCADD